MQRWATTLAAAALFLGGACGSAAVETERADRAADQPTATTAVEEFPDAGETSVPADTSTTSAPTSSTPATPATSEAAPPGGRAASTGVGDPLFPDLGSSDVDVLAYDVRLEIDAQGDSIRGAVTVDAVVTDGVGQLALDADGLDVSSVTVDGVDASFTTGPGELLIELPADREPTVTAVVSYAATPEPVGLGELGAGWYPTPGGSYVLNEPAGAHTWMPSNDHPSDKAQWRFELQVPDGLAAIANGELEQRGDGSNPWIWSQSEPMSTYLAQLIVGRYELIEDDPYVSVDGDVIPLLHALPAGSGDRYAQLLAVNDEQLPFFEGLFGPYPLERYGLAFVDDFPRGLAMETQGRSMFEAAVADASAYEQHLVLAHELAHQWFGDAVSPAEWDDIWLNESFATYAQWLWSEEAGFAPVDQVASASLRARQNGSEATGSPTAGNLFGFESYDGGAVILHALRLTIGDDVFFDLLRTWVDTYAGTAQSTETFIALAEDVSGRDLGAFFDDWLYATDLPDAFPA